MRVVAFDLECSSLSGMIGRVLCCSFKPIVPPEVSQARKTAPYTFRGDDSKFRNGDIANDACLVTAIRDELEKYDILVAWNGKLFDRKFLNARLLKAHQRPLTAKWFIDPMWAVRSHMRASSKLANIQEFLGLQDSKTPISWDSWMRGMGFDKSAMDTIVRHCEQDVKVLEEAYWRLLPLVRTIRRD